MVIATLMSCSKSESSGGASAEEQTVSLSLNLGELNMSRSIGVPATSATAAKVGDAIVIQALNGDGADASVLQTLNLSLTSNFTNVAPLYTSKTNLLLPSAATHIRVITNDDGETLKSNINTRQGAVDVACVRVSGTGGINVIAGATSTCAVTILPEMARIEVTGVLTPSDDFTHLQSVTISAIYINNTVMNRQDATIATASGKTESVDWTTAYATPKSNLVDLFTTAIAAGKGFGANNDHACGYNFFPQTNTHGGGAVATTRETALKYHPHIIFKVSYTKKGGSLVSDKYLNVVALKTTPANDYVQSFEAAKVYQFSLPDILDILDTEEPPVTNLPDPATVNVELQVTVGNWTAVTVKPEV